MTHVLVIDDSRPIRDLLAFSLRREGLSVSTASGSDEGLELIAQEHPDVVLLDLEMPDRDGVACLQEIRGNPATVALPVIMVSGTPMRTVVLRVAKIGVHGVVIKGEKMVEELARRIRQLVALASPPPLADLSESPGRVIFEQPTVAQPPGRIVIEERPAAAPPGRIVFEEVATPNALQSLPASGSHEDAESLSHSILQLDPDAMDISRAMETLRTLKPLMTRAELLDRTLIDTDLRAIKPAVQQVLALTRSTSASLEQIARAVKHDQALSLKILRIANSPMYTRGERVETVQKAVARIGLDQIQTTVLSISVMDRFGTVGLAGRIKADRFWEHSIGCGLIAAKIARMRGQPPAASDAMFTAGLLHDVGRVIYAEYLGEEYGHVIETADRLELPLETVESRLLLLNHADLTDRLLRKWHFAPELVNPIAFHHLSLGNIRRTVPNMAEAVATLGLANRLAHALMLGCSGNDAVYPIEEFVRFLGLREEHIREICDETPDAAADMRLLMLSHGAESESALLSDARTTLGIEVRPLVMSMQPGSSSIHVLIERLCPGAAGAPNLAVLQVNDIRERSPLLSRLRSAELERGLKDLPTLVVGSGAGCFYANGMLGGRHVEQLTMPVRLTRLLRSVRSLIDSAPATRAAA